jgi:hypothetical protein
LRLEIALFGTVRQPEQGPAEERKTRLPVLSSAFVATSRALGCDTDTHRSAPQPPLATTSAASFSSHRAPSVRSFLFYPSSPLFLPSFFLFFSSSTRVCTRPALSHPPLPSHTLRGTRPSFSIRYLSAGSGHSFLKQQTLIFSQSSLTPSLSPIDLACHRRRVYLDQKGSESGRVEELSQVDTFLLIISTTKRRLHARHEDQNGRNNGLRGAAAEAVYPSKVSLPHHLLDVPLGHLCLWLVEASRR